MIKRVLTLESKHLIDDSNDYYLIDFHNKHMDWIFFPLCKQC